jgi:hypothetical protein
MTPHMVHLIAQEIRAFRAMLTKEQDWLAGQPASEVRVERFRRIQFWRMVLKFGEDRLAKSVAE